MQTKAVTALQSDKRVNISNMPDLLLIQAKLISLKQVDKQSPIHSFLFLQHHRRTPLVNHRAEFQNAMVILARPEIMHNKNRVIVGATQKTLAEARDSETAINKDEVKIHIRHKGPAPLVVL